MLSPLIKRKFLPIDFPDLNGWYDANNPSGTGVPGTPSTALATWKDLSRLGNDGTQATSLNQGTIIANAIGNKYAIEFVAANQQYYNLPNGTIPYNNEPYSIYIVTKPTTLALCGLLGCGNYGVTNGVNAMRFVNDGGATNTLNNYWWGNDLVCPNGTVSAATPYVLSYLYNPSSGRNIYVNGVLRGTNASTANAATSANARIGLTYSTNGEYCNGYISEIVIYKAVHNTLMQRQVEFSLRTKYGI